MQQIKMALFDIKKISAISSVVHKKERAQPSFLGVISFLN
jgi:hypothetical protein